MKQLRVLVGSFIGRRTVPLLAAITISLIVLAIYRPGYFTLTNVRVVGLNVTSIAIASIGSAALIISGNVDLSLGSIFAIAAYTAASLSTSQPTSIALLGGLAIGGAIGWANGLLVQRIRVSPIIVTLGSLALLRGVLLVVSGGRGVADVPDAFTTLGRSLIFGIPLQLWILITIAIVADIILTRTNIGLHIFAIGGNKEAAVVAGIPVRRIALGIFAVNGVLVALAGVIAASRFGTATSQFGVGFELDVLTAVILGGVAFAGGEGSLRGVLLAVVFLGIVNSGMISLGVPAFYVDVIKGGALIASVWLEQITQERRERHRKRLAMAEYAQQEVEANLDSEERVQ